MLKSNLDRRENSIRQIAVELDYPPTPDIAAGVRARLAGNSRRPLVRPWYVNRLAWAVVAVILAAAILLAVPQARAAIFSFFQIGDIRIVPDVPTVVPENEASLSLPRTPLPTVGVTAEPTSTSGPSLVNLDGETTMEALEALFEGAILQPTYPADIGLPDAVYFQDQVGFIGIQVWLDTAYPSQVRAVLYSLILEDAGFAVKAHFQVESLTETVVNGQPAYWMEGQHMLSFYDESGQVESKLSRLVEGNTLIWTVGPVTYRLETALTMDEAIRMAESME